MQGKLKKWEKNPENCEKGEIEWEQQMNSITVEELDETEDRQSM